MRKHAPTAALVLAALALVGAVIFTALHIGRGEDSHVDVGRPAELRAKGLTLAGIGERLGVSHQYVHQLRRQAEKGKK